MDRYEDQFEVHSPRWGHVKRYTVVFTGDQLRVSYGPMMAVCKFAAGRDPEWVRAYERADHPLIELFRHDNIYIPMIVPFAFEWAWRKWREGEEPETLHARLVELFAWIIETAEKTPREGFWSEAF